LPGQWVGLSKNVTIHMLRHTYAYYLVMNGVDLLTVQELIGHSDIAIILRYAHLAPDHLRQTADKVPYSLSERFNVPHALERGCALTHRPKPKYSKSWF